MVRVRLVAAFVIALGGFSLSSPQPTAALMEACCTSGDGKETCCGETCWASGDSCGAKCTKNPLDCIKVE